MRGEPVQSSSRSSAKRPRSASCVTPPEPAVDAGRSKVVDGVPKPLDLDAPAHPLLYEDLINFPRSRGKAHARRCVMCGRLASGTDAACSIPLQNKDVCKRCDTGAADPRPLRQSFLRRFAARRPATARLSSPPRRHLASHRDARVLQVVQRLQEVPPRLRLQGPFLFFFPRSPHDAPLFRRKNSPNARPSIRSSPPSATAAASAAARATCPSGWRPSRHNRPCERGPKKSESYPEKHRKSNREIRDPSRPPDTTGAPFSARRRPGSSAGAAPARYA